RTDRLVNPALSELPAFLTREGGVNSGFMLAQVTAAAVASELKTLAHPAGVDTIPTSANKEDHVSMSMTAALKADAAVARAREVVHRNFMCMSGDRPARAARNVAAVEKCSLARPIARADARIRSPAVARHRRDRRSDCIERARKRMRRCSQVKNIFFLN